MQQTSLLAYREIKHSLNNRQKEVLDCVRRANQPVSNAQIANLMQKPINCITPRVLELRQKGLLYSFVVAKCPITKHQANLWWLKNA